MGPRLLKKALNNYVIFRYNECTDVVYMLIEAIASITNNNVNTRHHHSLNVSSTGYPWNMKTEI